MIILRTMRCTGQLAYIKEMRNVTIILVRKPDVKKLLGRYRHR